MQLRQSNIEKLARTTYDVLIIGGGINGAVSAAALAGKGVKTALIDKGDFAGFTSMNSSNLAWGGIKYMETYDFALVRSLCKSRNHLIKNYPSTIQEIRFLTTIAKGFRHHPLKLWAGTWLYWLIGNCFTRIPRLLSAQQIRGRRTDRRYERLHRGIRVFRCLSIRQRCAICIQLHPLRAEQWLHRRQLC